ncbi:hypothetical protein GOC23_30810 [Sinorhizobium meliloti]|nr:hypothetical protein [Sinorhizobium meliloti]
MKSYLQGFMAIQYSHLKQIPLECEKTASRRSNLAIFVAALLGEARPRILQERLQYPSYSF